MSYFITVWRSSNAVSYAAGAEFDSLNDCLRQGAYIDAYVPCTEDDMPAFFPRPIRPYLGVFVFSPERCRRPPPRHDSKFLVLYLVRDGGPPLTEAEYDAARLQFSVLTVGRQTRA